jgi:O-antigen/teichoic acid export membrane protein
MIMTSPVTKQSFLSKILATISRHLKTKGSFGRNVTLLVGGTALGQIIRVVATPVLTRLYTPEEFGILASFIALLGILSGAAGLRYELAIPLPEKERDAIALVLLALAISMVLSIAASIFTWFAGSRFLEWAGLSSLVPYMWLLPIGMVLTTSYQIFNFWAIRHRTYGAIARTKMSQAIGNVVTQGVAGSLSLGPIGLIVGNLVGRGLGTVTLARGFMKSLNQAKAINLFEAARRFIRFPKYSSVATTINIAGVQAPVLLITAYFGPEAAGWFLLSQRIMGLPMSLIGQSAGQVFTGEAATLARVDPARFYQMFLRVSSHLFIIGCPVLLLVGLIAPLFFGKIFGSGWEMSGNVTLVLTPMYIAQFTISPVSQTLSILERQDLQLYSDIIRLFVGVGSIWLTGGILGLSALYSIGIYGLAMMGAYLLLGYMSLIVMRRVN